MSRRESTLISFLVEKAKSKKYGSCLVYNFTEESFRLHLPQKVGKACAKCMQLLKDWNKLKNRNIRDADYSTAKHTMLVSLGKSPYVDYVDSMPDNGSYRTFKILSPEERKAKRLRQKNGRQTRSVSSDGYGSSTGSPLQSMDHLNRESNSNTSPTNAYRTSDYESEIDSSMSSADLNNNMNGNSAEVNPDVIPEANISVSGLSMEEGISEAYTNDDQVNSSISNAIVDQNAEVMTVSGLNREVGVSEAYTQDEPVNSSFNSAIVNQNTENMTEPGLKTEVGVSESYSQDEPVNSSFNNTTVDQITENMTDNMDVHEALREILQEFEVDMSDNSNEALQEYAISDADWNRFLDYLYPSSDLPMDEALSEKYAETVEGRIPKPKYYKLLQAIPLGEHAELIFIPMSEAPLNADARTPDVYWCEEQCLYKYYECYENADDILLFYIEADAIQTVQETVIFEMKFVGDHILFFLMPSKTIPSRNYSPFTDRLN